MPCGPRLAEDEVGQTAGLTRGRAREIMAGVRVGRIIGDGRGVTGTAGFRCGPLRPVLEADQGIADGGKESWCFRV